MGTHWCKLWPDKLLASSRYRRLNLYHHGVYFAVFLRVSAGGVDGELRTGPRPWTIEDLALDLNLDRRRVKRLAAALERLVEEGLLEVAEDGAWRVARWGELQAPSHAATLHMVSSATRSARMPNA